MVVVVVGVSRPGEEEGASVAVRRKMSVLKMHIAGQDAPSPSDRAYGPGLTRGESSMAQVSMVIEVHNSRLLAAQNTSINKGLSSPSSDWPPQDAQSLLYCTPDAISKVASVFSLTSSTVEPFSSSTRVRPPSADVLSTSKTAMSVMILDTHRAPVSGSLVFWTILERPF